MQRPMLLPDTTDFGGLKSVARVASGDKCERVSGAAAWSTPDAGERAWTPRTPKSKTGRRCI
jgi:hypothetical protein